MPEICRRYEGLDREILRQGSMHGISRILAAANDLVYLMLVHFTHEEQLLVKFSRDTLLLRHRATSMKFAPIKAELEQGKVAPIFQLLRLTKVLDGRAHESGGPGVYRPIEEENPFGPRPAVVDSMCGQHAEINRVCAPWKPRVGLV
jgi:hypothetical protein